ncbi:MAG: polyprenyl synthetase family protein [Clostridiales bacterium]|nr:polyprenyl synthetase family protein [Clostridiales bacterium]
MSNDFKERLDYYRSMIDNRLEQLFLDTSSGLSKAMRYSLLGGGKRIRPVLTLEFARLSGSAPTESIDVACSVELIHTYSLIHDDLPCMDNDDTRRNRPSNHIAFGEWKALLAGDALQSEAFGLLLNSPLPPERLIKAAQILARASGIEGICAGQYLDLDYSSAAQGLDSVRKTHDLKTGALFRAACAMGCAAAGACTSEIEAAYEYGSHIGLAFQIRDDLLDAQSDEVPADKPAGSDYRNTRSTYVTVLGSNRCRMTIQEETSQAIKAVSSVFRDSGFLILLAENLAGRSN